MTCIWNGWCHNRKPFVCCAVTNAAWTSAAVCISKQIPFFACALSVSKCTNIIHLWQQLEAQGLSLEKVTKFGLRGMAGGSYEPIKRRGWHLANRSSTVWIDSTAAEGGKLRWLNSATDLWLLIGQVTWNDIKSGPDKLPQLKSTFNEEIPQPDWLVTSLCLTYETRWNWCRWWCKQGWYCSLLWRLMHRKMLRDWIWMQEKWAVRESRNYMSRTMHEFVAIF